MTTVVLQPDAAAGKDTFLYSAGATTNYGTNTALTVGDASAASIQAYRVLAAFDVSGIPAGATISTVTLSLWEYTAVRTAGAPASWAVTLHRVIKNWVESEATWNKYSTAGGTWGTAGCAMDDADAVASASATLTMDADDADDFVSWSGAGLVADVQAWVDGTTTNYGWLLRSDAEYQADAADIAYNQFYSSDYTTDTARRPKLTIEYTTSSGAAGFYHTFMSN